jgi:hypothetical protein
MRKASHFSAGAVLAATVTVLPATADEVFLKGGGRVQGVVLERTEKAIVVETGPGRVTFPLSVVARVVEARSPLEAYRERAAELAPDDAAGWASLARWADERDLPTQSREAWTQSLRANPSNPEANEALGRVQLNGAWVAEEEAFRARGYVPYDGRWVTPAEHEALLRERAAADAAERESREAELRVREAEARAQEAMAMAASASAGSGDEGLPLWGGSGYAGGYWGGYGGVDQGWSVGGRRSGVRRLAGSLGVGRIEAGGVSPASHAVGKWRPLPPSNWRSVPYAPPAPPPARGAKSGSAGSSRRRD